MPLMLKSKYAEHRGCSKAYITKICREGKITVESDGRIDSDKADAILGPPKNKTQVNKPKGQNPKTDTTSTDSPGGGLTLTKARTAQVVVKTQREKLALEEDRGRLLDRDDVVKAAADASRIARDSLLGIPSRISPDLAIETDRRKVHDILKREIESVIEEFIVALSGLQGDG